MNIYFLMEGERTEMKVYPKWLSHLIPELQQIKFFDEAVKNNYYMISGYGYPALLNEIAPAVENINNMNNYDYFVICLDADEQSILDCKQEILDFMKNEKIKLNQNTKFEIIVQNKCIETWFLGNAKIFKKNPSSDFLIECVKFYDVKKNDPELMGKLSDFEASASIFHENYLRELLAERNVNYSKKNPDVVTKEYFLNELIKRNKKTNHIKTFKYFIDFCEQIRKNVTA